jgi:hypothetical protein
MISEKYGDYITVVIGDNKAKVETVNNDSNSMDYVPYEDDEEFSRSMPQSQVLDYNGKTINMKSINLTNINLTKS